jgi:hypothetical protein
MKKIIVSIVWLTTSSTFGMNIVLSEAIKTAIAHGDIEKIKGFLSNDDDILLDIVREKEAILGVAQKVADAAGIKKDFKNPTPKDRILIGSGMVFMGIIKSAIDIGLYVTNPNPDTNIQAHFGTSIFTDVSVITIGGINIYLGAKKKNPAIKL